MKKEYEKKYHDTERDHWWFKSRRSCIIDWLKHAPRQSRILDIGCSSGILLNELALNGFSKDNLYGIDISDTAIANAKQSGLPNVFVMDAQQIGLEVKFDFIIASDCLEHLKDDELAIRNWHGLLKPGGKMFVFVPAFMSLWSHHDVVNMHYRRYTRREMVSKFKKHFNVIASGYWNFFLFLPVFAYRSLSRMSGKSNGSEDGDISMSGGLVNSALTKLIGFENKLMRLFRFPFGVSTYVIVTK